MLPTCIMQHAGRSEPQGTQQPLSLPKMQLPRMNEANEEEARAWLHELAGTQDLRLLALRIPTFYAPQDLLQVR